MHLTHEFAGPVFAVVPIRIQDARLAIEHAAVALGIDRCIELFTDWLTFEAWRRLRPRSRLCAAVVVVGSTIIVGIASPFVNAPTSRPGLITQAIDRGAVSFLEVVTSQTVTLQTQLDSLNLYTRELRACVQLIRALGGDWTSAQSPRSLSMRSE
jgi:hypothetical protein